MEVYRNRATGVVTLILMLIVSPVIVALTLRAFGESTVHEQLISLPGIVTMGVSTVFLLASYSIDMHQPIFSQIVNDTVKFLSSPYIAGQLVAAVIIFLAGGIVFTFLFRVVSAFIR